MTARQRASVLSEELGRKFDALPQELRSAAQRASDAVNLALTVHGHEACKDRFMAIRLSDGGTDGRLYDSKSEAARFQLHEHQCAYVGFRNLMGGSTPQEMAIFLAFNRDAYQKGFRLVDPDKQGVPLITTGQRDFWRNRLFGGKR